MLNVKKLYELMEEKEVPSISSLARLVKIPYTTLLYMLSGHDMHVGTLVELSRFFNVPIDYLVNKSYSIVAYSEKGEEQLDTSSLIEALVSTTL